MDSLDVPVNNYMLPDQYAVSTILYFIISIFEFKYYYSQILQGDWYLKVPRTQ